MNRHIKRWIVGGMVMVALGTVVTLAACRRATNAPPGSEQGATIYTCPMHPSVQMDKPGECPICGMKLVPKTAAGAGSESAPAPGESHEGHQHEHPAGSPAPAETQPVPTSGPQGIYIPPDRQQLVGVKTVAATRQAVTQHVRTVGRVAYDPELMIAQREYLEAVRLGDRSLIEAATLHLQHMGISGDELARLRKGRREEVSLFLPHTGSSVWVYAPLFEHELGVVKAGMPVTVLPQAGEGRFPGTVRSIDPIIDPATRTARARIEVPQAGGTLRPDMYVNTEIEVPLGEQVVVPLSALIDTGKRKVVLLRHGEGQFVIREVTTGASIDDGIVITSGLTDGEQVVTRAAFLVNSESSLKAGLGDAAPVHQH